MKVKWTGLLIVLLSAAGTLCLAQGHGDPFGITSAPNDQAWVQVEYNVHADVYLIAWEDYRIAGYYDSDIYGQLVAGDGTLIGENFPICGTTGNQYWPRIAADPVNDRFLVVFEDQRNGMENGDVRGVFVDAEGGFVDAPTSEADHTFGVSTGPGHIYTCSVAYNYIEGVYLVIWADSRNSVEFEYTGVDIYGQMVAADGALFNPSDPTLNFPVDNADWYVASVADVTYNEITNEFLVAYGGKFSNANYILVQRVNHEGQRISPDGSAFALGKTGKTSSVVPAAAASGPFLTSPDGAQPRCASFTLGLEYRFHKTAAAGRTEVLVAWTGANDQTPPANGGDGYCQRMGFFREADKYVMKYISDTGDTNSLTPSNFAFSMHAGDVGAVDMAYGAQDNEVLIAWGDYRNGSWDNPDLYMQRLAVDAQDAVALLSDDRTTTVAADENIPLSTKPVREGGILGIAHNPNRNEFLVAYTEGSDDPVNMGEVMAVMVQGSPYVSVEDRHVMADGFRLYDNYPNPFNPSTTIAFHVEKRTDVRLRILDVQGRTVATLLESPMDAGLHNIIWNGRDSHGMDAASGVYLVQVEADRQILSRKITLIR
ncbi:T9SS type A sorting domain-containing protein [bacterium]|nr:T9SS type A sorting domain-containing protein [bacterium]